MKKQKYKKEYEKIVIKYARILNHHFSNCYCRFCEEVFKLNKKYFDMEELSK